MVIPNEFTIHPLACLSPDKTAEDQAWLAEDIKWHGQLVPIIRRMGQIIDGRHRMAACLEAGVDPRFEELPDDADPGETVLALVGLQKHMTDSQLTALAVQLSQWSTRGRPRAEDENCVDLRIITQTQATGMLGISRSLVTHAHRVFSDASPAVDELRRAVINGRITVTATSGVAQHPPDIQRTAVQMVVGGKAKNLSSEVRQTTHENALKEDAENLTARRTRSLGDTVILHTASVSDMKGLLAQASVAPS